MTAIAAAAAIGCAALAALVVSAALSAVVLRAGPVDPVGGRTSHRKPTPTSGGLAILAASGFGLAIYASLVPAPAALDRVGLALAFASIVGIGGALDDMLDMDARFRLALSVAVALAFVVLIGPVARLPVARGLSLDLWAPIGVAGAALWIVTASNAVNFMDGANGFAPGGLSVSFLALGVAAFGHGAAPVGVAALCAAAASIGFLPFNLRGRLFQGDAGALFAAFFFSALCLVAAGPGRGGGPVSLYFGPIALMPYLTDVLLTLLRRAGERKPLLSAHKEHLYQRWLHAKGWSHARLSTWGAGWMALSGALAVAASFTSEGGQAGALVLAVALSVIAWRQLDRRLR